MMSEIFNFLTAGVEVPSRGKEGDLLETRRTLQAVASRVVMSLPAVYEAVALAVYDALC